MDDSFDSGHDSAVWIGDTGLFIACGRQRNEKYTALERFVRRNDITFVIPERVYEELVGAPDRSTPGRTPIDSAIDASWVTVADEPDYTNGTVSQVMDDARRYIARSSNREEDHIEKADTSLAAVAADRLDEGGASSVCVVTTDMDAGEATVSALTVNGFEERIRFENGFELIERIS